MFIVLHIPTGCTLQISFNRNFPTTALFKSRAKAGKAIEEYRFSIKRSLYSHHVYVLSKDYICPGNQNKKIIIQSNTTIASLMMASFEPGLSPAARDKKLRRYGISPLSKEEFLIMETP